MLTRLVEGNLLDQTTDAIVNAWNRNIIPWWLLLPQGVSGAIKQSAGLAPFKQLGRMGPIPLGGAVLTTAGRLRYKAIIHVAGINMLWRAAKKSIQDSIRSATELATQSGLRSLAFPIIGAGSGSFDVVEAEQIMMETFAGLSHEIDVVVVRFGRS